VRVAVMQFTSEFIRDHIVRGRDDWPQIPDLLHIVPIPPKGTETGHVHLQDG